jgi:hypothetical protein
MKNLMNVQLISEGHVCLGSAVPVYGTATRLRAVVAAGMSVPTSKHRVVTAWRPTAEQGTALSAPVGLGGLDHIQANSGSTSTTRVFTPPIYRFALEHRP